MSGGFRTGLLHRLRRTNLRIRTQHQRLHELLRDAEAAALQRAPLRDCVAHLRDGLRAHVDLEEEVCFSALQRLEPAARSPLRRLARDHRAFLEELSELLEGPPDAVPRLLLLGQALREHKQHEEELFSGFLAGSAAADTA